MATRKKRRISIDLGETNELPVRISCDSTIVWADGPLSGEISRKYQVDYIDLGSGAQGVVDDFVAAVEAYVAGVEPLS